MTSILIGAEVARSTAERALLQLGANPEETEIVADVLVEADLRGQHSHGLMRLPTIAGRVAAGLILPDAQMSVTQTAPSVAAVDGSRGFGHVIATRSMKLAQTMAMQQGIGLVGVSNNNHIGMLGYYAEAAARDGCVAIICTISEAMVRPYEGTERLLGTNPIAIGIPALPDPFVLDFSTSMTAIGKLVDSAQRGGLIPDGWAVDSRGLPTNDANAALGGAINPFGLAKGYGLGLAVALLVGLLADVALNPEVVGTLDTTNFANKGDLFAALRPSALANGGDHLSRSSTLLDLIRHSRPLPGTERVMIPGDRGRLRRTEHLRDGIRLPTEVWDAVVGLSADPTATISPPHIATAHGRTYTSPAVTHEPVTPKER